MVRGNIEWGGKQYPFVSFKMPKEWKYMQVVFSTRTVFNDMYDELVKDNYNAVDIDLFITFYLSDDFFKTEHTYEELCSTFEECASVHVIS